MFNPLVADGGFAAGYAAVQLSDANRVAIGYGGATARGHRLDVGFKATEAPDIVSFRVAGKKRSIDCYPNRAAVVQSEGISGLKSAEECGRDLVLLPNDRTWRHASAVVLHTEGQYDTSVMASLPWPNDKVSAMFFGAVVRPIARHVTLTTNHACVVVLERRNSSAIDFRTGGFSRAAHLLCPAPNSSSKSRHYRPLS